MKIDRSSWPPCKLCSGEKVWYQSSHSTDLFMDKLKPSEAEAKMYKEEAESYLNKMQKWIDELEKKGY